MADTPYRPLDKESNYVNSWSRLDNNAVARNVTIMGADGSHITATGGKLDVNASVTISGNATEAKQDTQITLLQGIAGFTPSSYDYISLTYTGSNLTGVVFKTGGSGGTTIATLTLAYSGSNLISVTKT